MIPSDSEHTSAQQKPAPTSSAPSTRSSRRGGDQGRRGKEPSSSATREQHPPSSRESEKMRGSVDSDDEGRKVAGGSRREEEEDVKMESVDGHQVAKRSLDFGIDPSVRVVPATALSRCRQVRLVYISSFSSGCTVVGNLERSSPTSLFPTSSDHPPTFDSHRLCSHQLSARRNFNHFAYSLISLVRTKAPRCLPRRSRTSTSRVSSLPPLFLSLQTQFSDSLHLISVKQTASESGPRALPLRQDHPRSSTHRIRSFSFFRRVVEDSTRMVSLTSLRPSQNFVVLGFTHIEIVCAVQAAIAKLGGRYLLEKELETMKSEGEEEEQITNVDFVLISK
ncbi:hypothetical protein BDY24DRAFT_66937 [Mrakia frigida]|uniref:uncharacterized protein n=1 Tax=Mrakia frigida TaxID=29902 RepID=UPI003FCC0E9B